MTSDEAFQRGVDAWTTPETKSITLDSRLGVAFANIIDEIWAESKIPNLGCATTRELIEEITARIEFDDKLDYKTIDLD